MKSALCISRLAAQYLNGKESGPFNFSAWLQPRKTNDQMDCETCSQVVQLIPYVVLCHEGTILTYTRGKAGSENRLHDLKSLGIGGHVEEWPKNIDDWGHISLVIAEAALKELREETGIDLLASNIDAFKQTYTAVFNRDYVIYNTQSQVNAQHLGLLIKIELSNKDIEQFNPQAEKHIVSDLKFTTLTDIFKNKENYEDWSKEIIEMLEKINKRYLLVDHRDRVVLKEFIHNYGLDIVSF